MEFNGDKQNGLTLSCNEDRAWLFYIIKKKEQEGVVRIGPLARRCFTVSWLTHRSTDGASALRNLGHQSYNDRGNRAKRSIGASTTVSEVLIAVDRIPRNRIRRTLCAQITVPNHNSVQPRVDVEIGRAAVRHIHGYDSSEKWNVCDAVGVRGDTYHRCCQQNERDEREPECHEHNLRSVCFAPLCTTFSNG